MRRFILAAVAALAAVPAFAQGASSALAIQAKNLAAQSFTSRRVTTYIEDLPGVTVTTFNSVMAQSAATTPVQTTAQQTANTSAINAALAQGLTLGMRSCSRIEIATSIVFASNSAIVGDVGGKCGSPTIFMPADKFSSDGSNSSIRYDPNAVGMLVAGTVNVAPFTPITNVKISNIRLQSQVLQGRSLRGIAIRNAIDFQSQNVEIFGLPLGEAVNINSLRGNSFFRDLYVHDMTDNATTFPTGAPNVTAMLLDADTINYVPSDGVRIYNFRCNDITTGPDFQAKYGGDQSDCLNVGGVGRTNALLMDGFDFRRVGEGIDNFGINGRFVNGYIEDATIYCLKVVHSAKYNLYANITARRCGLAGITLGAGTGQSDTDVSDNQFMNVTIDTIDPVGTWAAGNSAGIIISSVGGATGPQVRNTTMTNIAIRPGQNAKYAYIDTTYSGNTNSVTDLTIAPGATIANAITIPTGGGWVQMKGSNARITGSATLADIGQNRSVNYTIVTAASYTPNYNENYIYANSASNAITLNLLPGWSGYIADRSGNAHNNPITISRPAAAVVTAGVTTWAGTATISGNILTVVSTTSGSLRLNQSLVGAPYPADIIAYLGVGQYLLSTSQNVATATAMSTLSYVVTVSSTTAPLYPGASLSGSGFTTANIASQRNGTPYGAGDYLVTKPQAGLAAGSTLNAAGEASIKSEFGTASTYVIRRPYGSVNVVGIRGDGYTILASGASAGNYDLTENISTNNATIGPNTSQAFVNNGTGATLNVNLPACIVAGKPVIVKDFIGISATNNIVVNFAGGIDSSTTTNTINTPYAARRYVCGGNGRWYTN